MDFISTNPFSPYPFSFLSFLFHNTIRSNKQAVGNKDSLILPFKQKCQQLLLLFPERLKGSECVHTVQRWASPAPYLPTKLLIKLPFHTFVNISPHPPFFFLYYFFFFNVLSLKNSLSGTDTSSPVPLAKGCRSRPRKAAEHIWRIIFISHRSLHPTGEGFQHRSFVLAGRIKAVPGETGQSQAGAGPLGCCV